MYPSQHECFPFSVRKKLYKMDGGYDRSVEGKINPIKRRFPDPVFKPIHLPKNPREKLFPPLFFSCHAACPSVSTACPSVSLYLGNLPHAVTESTGNHCSNKQILPVIFRWQRWRCHHHLSRSRLSIRRHHHVSSWLNRGRYQSRSCCCSCCWGCSIGSLHSLLDLFRGQTLGLEKGYFFAERRGLNLGVLQELDGRGQNILSLS